VSISAAALYRLVGDIQPTLLLDEADTYLGIKTAKNHEDLRGLINAGHRRGATVYRGEVAGKTVKVAEFPAFTPCALAGIGDLPDTILDRSVIVGMKRRAPHEKVEQFRDRHVRPVAEELRDRLAEWAAASVEQLRDLEPEMPPGITDRAADVWEPLLAIADQAGGEWPALAREAALELNAARQKRDPSLGVQLLADCRRVFREHGVDRLTSEGLIEALIALVESPWGDLRGKPLDSRGLANRLRKYDVHPATHRFDDGTKRGYVTEEFHDAWQRYLPPDVADVADVALPGGKRETEDDVALQEDEGGREIPSISQNPPLSPLGEAQQAKQAQHDVADVPGEEANGATPPSNVRPRARDGYEGVDLDPDACDLLERLRAAS
jgi:hypothetical protein